MYDVNKPYEYKLRITYLNGDYIDVYHYSDKPYADEAMEELFNIESHRAMATRIKPFRAVCINMYQVRSVEYLYDKTK